MNTARVIMIIILTLRIVIGLFHYCQSALYIVFFLAKLEGPHCDVVGMIIRIGRPYCYFQVSESQVSQIVWAYVPHGTC